MSEFRRDGNWALRVPVRAWIVVSILAGLAAADERTRADAPVPFTQVSVDSHGPNGEPYLGMHTKTTGDLNGDGKPDLVVAGSAIGELLVWYDGVTATRYTISDLGGWSTDAKIGDVDRDGDADVVISCWYRDDQGIEWFENLGAGTEFARHAIGPPRAHDLELVDLDLDGDLDIVTRQQEADGNAIELWWQHDPTWWEHQTLQAGLPAGEGLATGDIDRDGDADIVVPGTWFENMRQPGSVLWPAHVYTTAWIEPDSIVAVTDINRDHLPDVVLTPAENAGQHYQIAWFEGVADPVNASEWVEHVIDPHVECVMHSLQAADIDKDGDTDVVTAAMHQGADPDEVVVYLNDGIGGVGQGWMRQVIGTNGSHNMVAADFDGDGDVDLAGANWEASRSVDLWRNDINDRLPLDRWQREVIDSNRPWNAVFIFAGDVDRDGWPDVVTGGWWYRNPAYADAAWTRYEIGSPLNNMAAVYDYDRDGDLDVLGTPWAGSGAAPSFVAAFNDGTGNFVVRTDLPAGRGDFLQGVAVAPFSRNGPIETALSWHDGTGQGLQKLTAPAAAAIDGWTWEALSPFDPSEQLSAGDIDRDGRIDLLTGTVWLANEGGGSYVECLLCDTSEQPDRNRLADINGDGRLDAVVGYLGISKPAKLAWYAQPAESCGPWTEHVIDRPVGPMSLAVGDIDLDGDIDVVVGEHNLADPASARVLIYENGDGAGGSWSRHVVFTGDEHHDGTQLVDIDNDGDLDIVSIGWGHGRVLLYRNGAMESGVRLNGPPAPPEPQPPSEDDAPEDEQETGVDPPADPPADTSIEPADDATDQTDAPAGGTPNADDDTTDDPTIEPLGPPIIEPVPPAAASESSDENTVETESGTPPLPSAGPCGLGAGSAMLTMMMLMSLFRSRQRRA